VKYKVTWLPSAASRLADFWMKSRWASLITAAADWYDSNLATRPNEIGESRPAGFRIAFQFPLGITFFVDEDAQEVTVIRVWVYQ
jgi:hypothetical protein